MIRSYLGIKRAEGELLELETKKLEVYRGMAETERKLLELEPEKSRKYLAHEFEFAHAMNNYKDRMADLGIRSRVSTKSTEEMIKSARLLAALEGDQRE